MFVYNFFLPQTFINQQYEAIPKQNTIFKLIMYGIELHLKKEKINKRTLNFN